MNFNLRNKPFDDIRVCKGFSYAIDRQCIVNTLFQGEIQVETGPISSSSPFYYDDVLRYPLDIEKVNQLLDQAGYPRDEEGKRFSYPRH